jgi:hypothetical protein
MSCCSDNYIVPGANPANQAGGVESVGAGTPNVTITGTAINPLVNVTNVGGVTQVEGQIGNINLNGVGMTIQGGFPVLGDVTFTTAVQNITGSNAATVTNVGGTYNINVPSALVTNVTAGAGITVTQPTAGVYQVASVVPTPVATINGINGPTTLTCFDGSINIANNLALKDINITANFPQNVIAINPGNNSGYVSFQSTDNSVTITNPSPGNINLAVPPVNIGVASINSNTGAINLVGAGATTVSTIGVSTIQIATSAVTYISPGTNTNGVTLASADSTVNITNPSTGIINLAVVPVVPIPPTGSPNINVTSNVISLAYDATTAGKFSVQGPAGIGYTIAAGTTANFIITLGEALSYAFLIQKGINPNQGFFCVNFNIGMRTLLNANTNPGARLNVYLKNKNAGVGTSVEDMILATTNYQSGFESTVYCNFFLGSFQIQNISVLPNYDPNIPQLSLYVENQFSTDIRLNYVADKGWGYITQNNRYL